MFRYTISAVRYIRPLTISYFNAARIITNDFKIVPTTAINNIRSVSNSVLLRNNILSNNKQILEVANKIPSVPVRTVTKFSLKRGKRKTVKAVTRRFFRLAWGGWIRPKIGRHKKMWKKSSAQKRRLRQHVLCNAVQSNLLDKMVTKYWKKPKHYVEDPYAPYHTREEFRLTRKKPVVRN